MEKLHCKNKMDCIHRLREARRSHTQWVRRAKGLISGQALDKDSIPELPTDCSFGTWYYGAGQDLSTLPSFPEIESPHTELHNIYRDIINHLFEETDHSLLSDMFGQSHEHEEKIGEAKKQLVRLEAVSENIVGLMESLENEIAELTEENFAG